MPVGLQRRLDCKKPILDLHDELRSVLQLILAEAVCLASRFAIGRRTHFFDELLKATYTLRLSIYIHIHINVYIYIYICV